MTLQDTYKWGSLYVDAEGVLALLREHNELTEVQEDIIARIKESNVTFEFDDDFPNGCMYRNDGQVTPLVLIGHFGGYPGESIDEANYQAAKEWAEDKPYIFAYESRFGGCDSVALYLDMDNATYEDAEDAIELAERYYDYPILDEDLHSEIELRFWEEFIEEMIRDSEHDRDVVFAHDELQYIQESASEKMGWWEEGYYPADEWEELIDDVLKERDNPGTAVQLHQETKLW